MRSENTIKSGKWGCQGPFQDKGLIKRRAEQQGDQAAGLTVGLAGAAGFLTLVALA